MHSIYGTLHSVELSKDIFVSKVLLNWQEKKGNK